MMTYERVLSRLMTGVGLGSDDVKYLSNSSLRLADFLNRTFLDDAEGVIVSHGSGVVADTVIQFLFYFIRAMGLIIFFALAPVPVITCVMEATRFSSCFTYSARSSAKSASHSCSMPVPSNME